MTAQEILFFLEDVKPQSTGWIARCPAHDDTTPSLKIDSDLDGRVLLHCFAGCSYRSIMDGIRFIADGGQVPWWEEPVPTVRRSEPPAQYSPSTSGEPPAPPVNLRKPREIAYDYEDGLGRLLFQVVRREEHLPDGSTKKRFLQRRRPRSGEQAAADGWVYKLDGVPRVPYNLPAFAGAKLIYIVEGEKDAETLQALGLVATCNPGGAGKWRPEYGEYFHGKNVAILPDNDDPGRGHAEQVAASLSGVAEGVYVIPLPGLPQKGDVTDFINACGTVDDLIDLVERAEAWKPKLHSAGPDVPDGGESSDLGDDPPPELPEAALYGLAGQIVRTIAPHTEADPAALLFQLLAAFGCMVGREAWFTVEATRHYPKLFITLVGASSKARKGTSWSHICRVLTRVEPAFSELVHDGLSSGEGLIYHVRDPQTKKQQIKGKGGRVTGYQDVTDDEGAKEKRIFVQEPEFARLLRALAREGNTLSAVIRQAWDSDRLRTMTKNPVKASDAHVAISAHITLEELRRNLDETETSNGFANRFLWVFVRRSRLLPFGGNLHESELNSLIEQLKGACDFAKQAGEMLRDDEADSLWSEVYGELSEGRPGLFGSVTSRAEAQVMRLSMIYALMDRSSTIRREHLEAALAAWQYCSDSARCIFGRRTGDKVADKILSALRENPDPLSRTAIRDLFGRNKDSASIDAALKALLELGLIDIRRIDTDGRPIESITLRRHDKNDRTH